MRQKLRKQEAQLHTYGNVTSVTSRHQDLKSSQTSVHLKLGLIEMHT